MFIGFLVKKTAGGVVKNEIMQNESAELTDMQLLSKFNKEICLLLCVTDNYGKSAWVVLLKGKKKVLQLLMLFKKYYTSQAQTKQNMGR